ncbi:MAG: hypothetical protein R3C03_22715 [Pirellulaceae bacterium]
MQRFESRNRDWAGALLVFTTTLVIATFALMTFRATSTQRLAPIESSIASIPDSVGSSNVAVNKQTLNPAADQATIKEIEHDAAVDVQPVTLRRRHSTQFLVTMKDSIEGFDELPLVSGDPNDTELVLEDFDDIENSANPLGAEQTSSTKDSPPFSTTITTPSSKSPIDSGNFVPRFSTPTSPHTTDVQTRDQDLQQRNSHVAAVPRELSEARRDANNIAEAPNTPSIGNTTRPPPSTSSPPQIGGRDQGVFQLAAQPKEGDVFEHHRPSMSRNAVEVDPQIHDFDLGPCYGPSFDPHAEMNVYEGKRLNAVQRPLVELGRPWYQLGPISEAKTFLGKHNPVTPQFVVFGDSRIAAASNENGNNYGSLIAIQNNLFFDLKVTGTERLHLFASPSTRGANSTRYEFSENDFVSEFNFNPINGFIEGDLGSIWGGLSNQTMPFDLPFAVGIMPLLFQNGVWMEDNILGLAATVPARNIPAWNVTNMDVTFFAGYDNVTSPAFGNDNNAGRIYGLAGFVEAWNGYVELDYAFLDDRLDIGDRSYHNIGVAYSRRLGRFLSNSTRVIVNAGQDTGTALGTADGVLLLSENSLITSSPSTIVPYLNFFAGFDRPQSAARAAAAGGVLRNTGILFESDNLTGYPTLDASANNTFGGALGLNLLAYDFSQQLVLEAAAGNHGFL